MPNKSRRVAAKQAELGQRKRRASKHSSSVEAHIPIVQASAATSVDRPTAAIPSEASAPATAPDIPRVVPQQRLSHTADPRSINPYIWPEIRRIGIITGPILIILAVLTVVLK